jgi:prepilin-type processing-associated H-X9-DG protein
MKIPSTRNCFFGGFTPADALMLVGVLFLLAVLVWAGNLVAGEQRRIFLCAHHMKLLGHAFSDYAHDHDNTLPPAVLDDGTEKTSWDTEIAPYLEPGLAKENSPGQRRTLEAKVAPLFKCPSDREPREALPRSYSMPMYDVNHVGWPPDDNSVGGLGLYLDAKALRKIGEMLPDGSKTLPAIKLSMALAPSDTALLGERISILNVLWQTKCACISSPKEQFEAKTFESKDFHGGKMNYLMLDGHVELLTPLQTGGIDGHNGIWSIKKGY